MSCVGGDCLKQVTRQRTTCVDQGRLREYGAFGCVRFEYYTFDIQLMEWSVLYENGHKI